MLTVWLVQRGSPESKPLDKAGRESDKDQMVGKYATSDSPAWARAQGWRRALFSRSLGLVMGLLFVISWTAQFIAGRSAYNAEQLMDLQAPLTRSEYLAAPRLLEPHTAELAVRAPGRGQHGRVQCLAARSRVSGVQAGWRSALGDRCGGLNSRGLNSYGHVRAELVRAQAARLWWLTGWVAYWRPWGSVQVQ